jgi:hypothetical protein
MLIKKPVTWISSLYDFISPYFGHKDSAPSVSLAPDDSPAKVKPTGGLSSPRPSGRD